MASVLALGPAALAVRIMPVTNVGAGNGIPESSQSPIIEAEIPHGVRLIGANVAALASPGEHAATVGHEAPIPAVSQQKVLSGIGSEDIVRPVASGPVRIAQTQMVDRQKVARPKADDAPARMTATATWYGPGFHGRTTANGETFDQDGLTAAHRTLPFDTKVRVTALATGRSVIVKINDRGPYSAGRDIDLSAAAARAIGIGQRGSAKVRLEILDKAMASATPERSAAATVTR